jgi:hypothetical protein
LAGFSTGGSCFGYTSKAEETPENPDHPRYRVVELPAEAATVRRIFQMFLEGQGSFTIADRLNHENVPPPRGRAWRSTQIEYVLNNERYIGKVVWRKNEWLKDPLTKKHRIKKRPQQEWIVFTRPDLAIVSLDLWDRVRALRASRGKYKSGRPPGRPSVVRPLSGLLHCGVCGGLYYVMTGVNRQGVPYVDYGCGTHRRAGSAVCSNQRITREFKLQTEILRHVREFLTSEKYARWVEEGRLRYQTAQTCAQQEDVELKELSATIKNQEARVERVLEMVASGETSSDLLKKKLSTEEAKLMELRSRVSKLLAPRAVAPTPIDLNHLRPRLEALDTLFTSDPEEARDLLHKLIRRVVVVPMDEGIKLKITLVAPVVAPPQLRSVKNCIIQGCGEPTGEQLAPFR